MAGRPNRLKQLGTRGRRPRQKRTAEERRELQASRPRLTLQPMALAEIWGGRVPASSRAYPGMEPMQRVRKGRT